MNVTGIKAAVRERDGYRCTKCGVTNDRHKQLTGRQLEVHRTTPGSPYSVADCVTLCRRCHGPEPRRRHGQRQREDGVLSFDADSPVVVRAIRLAAAISGRTMGQVLNELIREHLPEYVALAREAIERQRIPPQPPDAP